MARHRSPRPRVPAAGRPRRCVVGGRGVRAALGPGGGCPPDRTPGAGRAWVRSRLARSQPFDRRRLRAPRSCSKASLPVIAPPGSRPSSGRAAGWPSRLRRRSVPSWQWRSPEPRVVVAAAARGSARRSPPASLRGPGSRPPAGHDVLATNLAGRARRCLSDETEVWERRSLRSPRPHNIRGTHVRKGETRAGRVGGAAVGGGIHRDQPQRRQFRRLGATATQTEAARFAGPTATAESAPAPPTATDEITLRGASRWTASSGSRPRRGTRFGSS